MRMPHAAFCKNLLITNNRSQQEVIRLDKVSCNMPENSKCLPDCIRKNSSSNIPYSAHFQVQAFINKALMLKEILCLSVSVSLKPSKEPSLLWLVSSHRPEQALPTMVQYQLCLCCCNHSWICPDSTSQKNVAAGTKLYEILVETMQH